MKKTLEQHYKEYDWADKDHMMAPVKLEGDDREWFYTAKKIHKGILVARVITMTGHHGHPGKKLIPMDKVTFL